MQRISHRAGVLTGLLALTVAFVGCTTETVVDWPPAPAETASSTPIAGPAVTLEQLLTADVPSLCGHEPDTLVDGVLPGLERTQHFSMRP